MASNTNLAMSRIALAAIALTTGNKRKFSPLGSLQASRSPQNAGLITEMNPKNAKNNNRLSIVTGMAIPMARVTLNYRPQFQATVKTQRTVATGVNPTDGQTLNVDYNTHRELDLTYRTVDILRLEKETEDYLTKSNNGSISVKVDNFSMLSDMGDQIMRIADSVLLNVNTSILTSLISAVGGNLMLGQTSNTGVPTIQAFNSDGGVNPNVMDWFNDLKTIHSFEGKPIVIGGLKAQRYFNRKSIVSTASLGYDYEKVFQQLDVEFYYDPLVDQLSGQDHIIVMDAGAFVMETILEHAKIEDGGVIPATKVANTNFGQASLSVAQTNAPTFTLDHDLRVREDDTSAYPNYTITPSLHYGTFARPAGYFKNYGGWDTVTGIFRAKLL